MDKKIIFICACNALIGCQYSISDYETFLQSWVGKSEAKLVETWGAPDQMQTIGPNRQIFVYIKSQNTNIAGAAMPAEYLGPDSMYTQNTDAFTQRLTYYCQTTFTAQNNIIVDYSFEGDGCRKE